MTNKANRRAVIGWGDPSSLLIGRGPSPTTQMQPNACFASKLILSSCTPPSEAEPCHDKKHAVTKDNVECWDTGVRHQGDSGAAAPMMRSAEQGWWLWPNLGPPRSPDHPSPHHHSHHTSPSNLWEQTSALSLSQHSRVVKKEYKDR